MFLVLIFTRGWVDPKAMVRTEGNMSLKNPVSPPGFDPGTVRLVAQRLNHYAISSPYIFWIPSWIPHLLLLYSWSFSCTLPRHFFHTKVSSPFSCIRASLQLLTIWKSRRNISVAPDLPPRIADVTSDISHNALTEGRRYSKVIKISIN
jgi:hypothetical protein